MKKYQKRLILWLTIALILFLSVILIIFSTKSDSPIVKSPEKINGNDWTLGNPEATVTLIEYSDFECPACSYFSEMIDRLMREFEDYVYFAYRHYPLEKIHENAYLAARAAEASGKQGEFFRMSRKIFGNQAAWANQTEEDAIDIFTAYAEELNLDIPKFIEDLNSEAVKNQIDADILSAKEAGIYFTPSFFLNGELISHNPTNYEDFRKLIINELEKNE